MLIHPKPHRMRTPLFAAFLALAAGAARADPEIMVHQNDLAGRGEVTATLHANITPRGDRARSDGTWGTHRLASVMAELATGLAPGWEAGVHLPFMRAGTTHGSARKGELGASALMLRIKHVRELGDGLYWGFNGEYDVNASRYVAEPRSIELRGIVGHKGEILHLTANPHLIWGLGGGRASEPPAFNVDWKATVRHTPALAWGVELYTDWGRVNRPRPGQGDRTLYLVLETETPYGTVHLGLGRGFKDTPERQIFKLVWSTAF